MTSTAADRPILVVAAIAGVVAAIALPDRPGIGWLITGAASAGGLLFVGAREGASARHGSRLAWGATVLILLGVGTVRDAGWLFVLCVLTAVGCAALGTAGARTTLGTLLAGFALLAAPVRALPWAARGARSGSRTAPTNARTPRLMASAGIAVLLLGVFSALFASADPAFGRILRAAVPDVDGGTVLRWLLLFVIVGGATLGAAFLLVNPTTLGLVGLPAPRPLRRLEWALPVGAVLVTFAAFVAVQATVLFGGRDHVLRTVGLTFAQYARRGFWQLLVVTLLTLVVIAVAMRKAPRGDRGDRLMVRVLLGGLSLGALVVVASALWRMSVYEQAYGYTRLRVFVSAFELWLGALFLLVLAAGLRLRAGWVPQAAVAAWVVTLVGLAVLNPDRFIARENIDRSGTLDARYLSTLSADAVPELDRLPVPLRDCALSDIARRLREDPDDWRSFNTSRATAATIVTDVREPGPECTRRR